MRKEKKYNYIYKITCLVTDRFYIGLHSTDNLEDGYMGSGKRLWYSFKKYGKDNHKKEILEYLPTRKLLKEREKEIVNEELIDEELCMNLALGGTGGILNEEHGKKLKEGASNWMKEKWNDTKYRENHSKRLSKLKKESWSSGNYDFQPFDWTGKKHTEESKNKISESKKGQGLGKTNSQYGTMWITNDIDNKKFSKNELIPEGWRKGRIINK